MEAKNIDSILIQAMSQDASNEAKPIEPEIHNVSRETSVQSDQLENVPRETIDENTVSDLNVPRETLDEETSDIQESKQSNVENNESSSNDSPIDEYGNPIEKPKMYSEEDVQRMIRDRLSRGKQQEQLKTTETESTKPVQEGEEQWEQQLESFIEKTIEKRNTKLSEQKWREQEIKRQADFEARFHSGMERYQDFNKVVEGKPITDSMMLASRSLEQPAAFIYGACKMFPQEIERISRIPDERAQILEIGKLEERMKKVRSAIQGSKPLESPKGDLPNKNQSKPSLDYLISQHAKQKFARR